MPKLIPTSRAPVPNGNSNDEDEENNSPRSQSNDLPLNEDPMNLVETSWDITSSLQNSTSDTPPANESSNDLTPEEVSVKN